MNIEELTVGQAKELAAMFGCKSQSDDSHWKVGSNYLIRTVTMIQAGKLVKVTDKELVLQDASWVADTGRFQNALQSGEFAEVEMFPNDVIIGRAAIIDATTIAKIPTAQK